MAELTDEDRRILEVNQRARLAEVVQKHCSPVLKTITQHKWAFPFNSPVDTTRFPDYPKIIATPMDFSTIRIRQDSGYYRDPKEWWADVMLVFTNAKRYNAPGSDCHLMAQTLQEVSEEKYDKVLAPRLAEEAAATLREEAVLKKRRAELVNAAIGEAMDAQCAVLFNLMAELHAAIREAKALASSLCDPLTLEEKQALAATIQALPTAQLEAIVAFVASRHPPSVSQSDVQPGGSGGGATGGSGGGAVPSRKVQLHLGRYDPLLLRQLQHLVATCTVAQQQGQQQAQGQPPGPAPPLMLPRAKPRAVSPQAGEAAKPAAAAAKAASAKGAPAAGATPGGGDGGSGQVAAATTGTAGQAQAAPRAGPPQSELLAQPSSVPGQADTTAASSQAAPVPAAADVGASAGAAAPGPSTSVPAAQPSQAPNPAEAGLAAATPAAAGSQQPQASPTPALPQQQQDQLQASAGPASKPQPAAASQPAQGGQAAAPEAGQGAAEAGPSSAAPAAAAAGATGPASAASSPAAAPPAVGSTQRNISDVVTNATASGVSLRAGIKWPGVVVGAGVRPRARALLSLQLEGPASAHEMLAVCPLPAPAPSRPRGTKRTAAAAALQADGAHAQRPVVAGLVVSGPHQAQAPVSVARSSVAVVANGLDSAGAARNLQQAAAGAAAHQAAGGTGLAPMDVDGQAAAVGQAAPLQQS